MCYFNRLTRVARCLVDYLEWLQFCWDFVKPPRNDEIALQHFFFLLEVVQESFSISFVLHAMFFFQQALAGIFSSTSPLPPPPPPQELNGRPLNHVEVLMPCNATVSYMNIVYNWHVVS